MTVPTSIEITKCAFCMVCGAGSQSGTLALQAPLPPHYKRGELFEFGKKVLVFKFTCLNGHKSEMRSEALE